MKKKILITFVCGMILLAGCQKYVNEDETYNTVNTETKENAMTSKYATLPEIRETKEEVMEQAYNGKWNNLHFNQFEPHIPDEDEIYNITWEDKNYKGLTGIDIFKE